MSNETKIKDNVKELRSLFNVQVAKFDKHMSGGQSNIVGSGWVAHCLWNFHTNKESQIYEFIIGAEEATVPSHVHIKSTEVFYIIEGEFMFNDCERLTPGSIKVIEPGEEHTIEGKPNSKAILIVHPTEEAYKS